LLSSQIAATWLALIADRSDLACSHRRSTWLALIADRSDGNFKRLGYRLALKWPYGDDWGWVIGNFKKVCTSGHYKGHFVMRWEDGEETYWPKEPRTTYGPDRKWVLLKHK
jgi:hypothetical protein